MDRRYGISVTRRENGGVCLVVPTVVLKSLPSDRPVSHYYIIPESVSECTVRETKQEKGERGIQSTLVDFSDYKGSIVKVSGSRTSCYR